MFSEKERGIIISYYELSDCASRTACLIREKESFYVSNTSVLNIWRQEGLKIRSRGGNNNPTGRKYVTHRSLERKIRQIRT